MNTTDHVRAYALRTYIHPARQRGDSRVTFVSGDIGKALKLTNRMPLVCNAFDAKKFHDESRLRLIQRDGPRQGATVSFTFQLL